MSTVNIKLYDFARHKLNLNEDDAKEFIAVLNEADEYSKTQSATKQDIAELKNEIKESKIDTLKWMFGIFVALMLAIVGLYFKK
jgi:hypothetical protein